MPFGKKYRKAVEGLDLSQRFSVEEAVEKSLGASFAKFDETVDVAIGLGVDPKYSDQMGPWRRLPASWPGQDRSRGRVL